MKCPNWGKILAAAALCAALCACSKPQATNHIARNVGEYNRGRPVER